MGDSKDWGWGFTFGGSLRWVKTHTLIDIGLIVMKVKMGHSLYPQSSGKRSLNASRS